MKFLDRLLIMALKSIFEPEIYFIQENETGENHITRIKRRRKHTPRKRIAKAKPETVFTECEVIE